MGAFRALLIGLWLVLAIYTGVVISRHGLDLLPVFFGDIGRLAWPGQFNLDFLSMLILSASWTAWRNGFSALGLLLGLLAFFGGAGFLLIYLLVLTGRSKSDWACVLLGPDRAATRSGSR